MKKLVYCISDYNINNLIIIIIIILFNLLIQIIFL